jgi:calcium/calmodulin-dependent protein kinase I
MLKCAELLRSLDGVFLDAALQDQLFDEILMGHYEFPDREWKDVSSEAKHLVSKLLVTNPLHRFSADEVLEHTWIYDQLHKARSNILQYASKRLERFVSLLQ